MSPTRLTSLLIASALLAPAAAQDTPEIDSPAYQAQDAETKRDTLWDAIAAQPYAGDPPTGGAVFSATKLIWAKLTLAPTFKDGSDLRAARNKTFHRWGTSVKVRFEPSRDGITGALAGAQAGPTYSGIFATGAVGIARLSLGLGDTKLWAPGIGLKLFVDGAESVNVHAIPRDGAQESKDFLAATLSTQIDPTPLDGFLKFSTGANPTLRRVDHLAATGADGTQPQETRSPQRLEFRAPAGIAFSEAPAWGQEDFRRSLAKIPAGVVLYEVWAFAAEDDDAPVRIGVLRTESAFVASAFQDRRLHFKHVD